MDCMICKDVMLLLNLRHGATQVVENLHRIRLTLLILEIKRGSPNNQNDNLDTNVSFLPFCQRQEDSERKT